MTVSSFWDLFNKIQKDAKLPIGKLDGGYTLHDLRRTCATVLYNKGKGLPLKEISKRLGHSSVIMTEKYLRLDEDEDPETTNKIITNLFTESY